MERLEERTLLSGIFAQSLTTLSTTPAEKSPHSVESDATIKLPTEVAREAAGTEIVKSVGIDLKGADPFGREYPAPTLSLAEAVEKHDTLATAQVLPTADDEAVSGTIGPDLDPDVYRVAIDPAATALSLGFQWSDPAAANGQGHLVVLNDRGDVLFDLPLATQKSILTLNMTPAAASPGSALSVAVFGPTGVSPVTSTDYALRVTRNTTPGDNFSAFVPTNAAVFGQGSLVTSGSVSVVENASTLGLNSPPAAAGCDVPAAPTTVATLSDGPVAGVFAVRPGPLTPNLIDSSKANALPTSNGPAVPILAGAVALGPSAGAGGLANAPGSLTSSHSNLGDARVHLHSAPLVRAERMDDLPVAARDEAPDRWREVADLPELTSFVSLPGNRTRPLATTPEKVSAAVESVAAAVVVPLSKDEDVLEAEEGSTGEPRPKAPRFAIAGGVYLSAALILGLSTPTLTATLRARRKAATRRDF